MSFFFIYKNLQIEPFNYAIKSICFRFRSTNVGSSVVGTGRIEGSHLPYFYQFQCYYSLITYFTLNILPVVGTNSNQIQSQLYGSLEVLALTNNLQDLLKWLI